MKLKILNLDYELIEQASISGDDGTALFGEVKYHPQSIRVDREATKERKAMTILHEALHAYNDQLKFCKAEDMENQFDLYASLIYNFLANNKDVLKKFI